jgi:hypothetical protein
VLLAGLFSKEYFVKLLLERGKKLTERKASGGDDPNGLVSSIGRPLTVPGGDQ